MANDFDGRVSLNPFEYPAVKCDKCGNEAFIQAVIIREIPGVCVGEKDTQYVPMKVFICSKCGELSPVDKKQIANEEKMVRSAKKGTETPKSPLIL